MNCPVCNKPYRVGLYDVSFCDHKVGEYMVRYWVEGTGFHPRRGEVSMTIYCPGNKSFDLPSYMVFNTEEEIEKLMVLL